MIRRSALLALAAAALGGCGSGPRLVPVTGTVTLNGKPLEGAELTFVPDPTNAEVTPGADVSGPDGNYKARFQDRFGLAPGKYKVLVRKMEAAGKDLPAAFQADPAMAGMAGLTKEALPPSYADASKSTFEIDVTEGGKQADFDIKAKAK